MQKAFSKVITYYETIVCYGASCCPFSLVSFLILVRAGATSRFCHLRIGEFTSGCSSFYLGGGFLRVGILTQSPLARVFSLCPWVVCKTICLLNENCLFPSSRAFKKKKDLYDIAAAELLDVVRNIELEIGGKLLHCWQLMLEW